jgi:hypothetical protein
VTRVLGRVRAALLGLGLLAVTVVCFWSAPTAARASGCTAPQVAVLVDLSRWGGSDRVGCVSWTSSLTGYDALHSAGFSTTGTVHDGPGFVCRIDGYPAAGAPDHEACVSTPPASKYWSYWHAEPGQTSWTFSTLGAMSYHPHAGSAEAWTFGAGSAPSVAPSAAMPGAGSATTSRSTSKPAGPPPPGPSFTHRSTPRTTSASTRRSASTEPKSRPTDTGGPAPSAPGSPAATNPSGTAQSSSAVTASAASTSASAGASPAGTGTGTGTLTIAIGRTPVIVSNRSSAAVSSTKPSGSPGPTIAGVLVVAALAAGGGFYAWRRRESRGHAG